MEDKIKQIMKQQLKKIAKIAIKKVLIPASIGLLIIVCILAVIISAIEGLGATNNNENANLNYEEYKNLEETSSRDLAKYLRQFSHSGEAPKSEDGKFYYLYVDSGGNPTIGNGDIKYVVHHSKFDIQGRVLSNGKEEKCDSVENYINQKIGGYNAQHTEEEMRELAIYIEVELVDRIATQIREPYYQDVVEKTQGLGLSQQQIDALTTIKYHVGHLPTVNKKEFSTVYKEARQKIGYEMYKYIWDNWWYNSFGEFTAYSGNIKARDAAFETFVKGTYDFTSTGGVFSRQDLLYYTSDQLEKLKGGYGKGLANLVSRSENNEKERFTYVENNLSTTAKNISANSSFLEVAKYCHDYLADNQYFYSSEANKAANRYVDDGKSAGRNIPVDTKESIRYIDCSAYVSWVLYEYGYTEIKGWQKTSSWFFGECTSHYPSWKKVSLSQAQAGDILAKEGHVEIYVGNGKVYNCGATSAIRAKEPTSQTITNGVAIRVTKKK